MLKKAISSILLVTIIVLTISGCGKVAKESGSSGGGDSPTETFSITGTAEIPSGLSASLPSRIKSWVAQLVFTPLYAAGLSPFNGAAVKIYELGSTSTLPVKETTTDSSGGYNISGLDANKTYVVSIEKSGLNVKNIATKSRYSDTVDIAVNPVSTITTEIISANSTAIAVLGDSTQVKAGKTKELITILEDEVRSKADETSYENILKGIGQSAINTVNTQVSSVVNDAVNQIKDSKRQNLTVLATDAKTADGNPSDWQRKYTVLFDDALDDPNNPADNENPRVEFITSPNLKIKSVKVAKDNDYLYILCEADTAFSMNPADLLRYGVSILPAGVDEESDGYGRVNIEIDKGTLQTSGGPNNDSGWTTFTDTEATGNVSVDNKYFEMRVKIDKIKSIVDSPTLGGSGRLPSYDNAVQLRIQVLYGADAGSGTRYETRARINNCLLVRLM